MRTGIRRSLALVLALMLALSGCEPVTSPLDMTQEDWEELEQTLTLSLGLLDEKLTQEEREAARTALLMVWPLRKSRLEHDRFSINGREREAMERYSTLLDSYTEKYLGEDARWWYSDPEMIELAEFTVDEDGGLTRGKYHAAWEEQGFQEGDGEQLWLQVQEVLPREVLQVFEEFTLFTDGAYETVAYTYWNQNGGVADSWGLALDPVDTTEWDYMVETLIHEYAHVLSLKRGQVRFDRKPVARTYCEEGLYAHETSWLNAFYQEHWGFLYDERRVNDSSTAFYYRHEDRFCSEYATVDPSEDFAETFTYYVLWGREEWEEQPRPLAEKLAFFDRWEEFSDLREQLRVHMGLEEPAA